MYSNLSPTIYGGGEVLPAQSVSHLKARKPFTDCNAGHTFFHVDRTVARVSARWAATSRSVWLTKAQKAWPGWETLRTS